VTRPRLQAEAISFTDGLNGQATYHYHVQLTGLEPGTRYYYRISDGAAPEPSTAYGSFETAPAGRARFRFSSFGDLATPSWDRSASGNQ
jgi:phosphodiesterase/alkaline phosphatase D-like protein